MLGSRRGLAIRPSDWSTRQIKARSCVIMSVYLNTDDARCTTCESDLMVSNMGEFYCERCKRYYRDCDTLRYTPVETSEDDLLNKNVDSKICVPTARQHLSASHYLLEGIYPPPYSTLRDAPSNADSPRVPPPLSIPRDRSDISSVTNMSTLHEANRTASANAYDRWLLQKTGHEKYTSTMSSPGDAD